MSDIKRCDYCPAEIKSTDAYCKISMTWIDKAGKEVPLKDKDCCENCFGGYISLKLEKRGRTRKPVKPAPNKPGRPRGSRNTQAQKGKGADRSATVETDTASPLPKS